MTFVEPNMFWWMNVLAAKILMAPPAVLGPKTKTF
jgi:hypothetical protein